MAEAIDLVWWLHTHPRVMAERAAILAPLEELMWQHDIPRRGPLVEANRWRKDAIDDALSREIVEPRDDGRNPPDRPWRPGEAAPAVVGTRIERRVADQRVGTAAIGSGDDCRWD